MKVGMCQNNKGFGLTAISRIALNERIFDFERNFLSYPTNKTLRIDEHRHQLSADPYLPENFLNHSCDPTAYIQWGDLSLLAARVILPGEEITYNYFTSDWDGEDPFICNCGSLVCEREVKGFKYLNLEKRLKLKKYLSPFLQNRIRLDLPV